MTQMKDIRGAYWAYKASFNLHRGERFPLPPCQGHARLSLMSKATTSSLQKPLLGRPALGKICLSPLPCPIPGPKLGWYGRKLKKPHLQVSLLQVGQGVISPTPTRNAPKGYPAREQECGNAPLWPIASASGSALQREPATTKVGVGLDNLI